MNENKKDMESFAQISAILEESNDENTRLKCLDKLIKFNIDPLQFEKILEDLIISEESELIRARALELFYEKCLKINTDPLEWSIRNDNSSIILVLHEKLLNQNLNDETNNLKSLIKERYKKIASLYHISPEELKFFLDLGIKFNLNKKYSMDSYLEFSFLENIAYEVENNHVKALNVSFLNDIPNTIKNLKYLEHLDLSCNYLMDLPQELSSLKRLKFLGLNWNQFDHVPLVIKELRVNENLELELNHNFIKEFPEWLACVKNLKSLSLRYNKIESFHILNSNSTILDFLDLSYNKISKISLISNTIQNLKVLLLNHNSLVEIPEDFSNFHSLERLELQDNQIKTIPKFILDLDNLKILNLRNNPIKKKNSLLNKAYGIKITI
ncbi:MAG: leucine-rich repeat domain-containing protein [Promethearchaeota archaeon]